MRIVAICCPPIPQIDLYIYVCVNRVREIEANRVRAIQRNETLRIAHGLTYGVALVSRLLQVIGLFCKRAL